MVYQIVNCQLSSNSFVLWNEPNGDCWIIDPGDVEPIRTIVNQYNLRPEGILLTHYHFDHIYGINNVRQFYNENLPIFCGSITRDGLLNAKVNMSLYGGRPFVVEDRSINTIEDGDRIRLWNNIDAIAYHTPGHNDDCFSYEIGDMLFTGDALIPHIKVHTKSKNSDKIVAQQTVERILRDFAPETTIYPGHNSSCKLNELL